MLSWLSSALSIYIRDCLPWLDLMQRLERFPGMAGANYIQAGFWWGFSEGLLLLLLVGCYSFLGCSVGIVFIKKIIITFITIIHYGIKGRRTQQYYWLFKALELIFKNKSVNNTVLHGNKQPVPRGTPGTGTGSRHYMNCTAIFCLVFPKWPWEGHKWEWPRSHTAKPRRWVPGYGQGDDERCPGRRVS